MVSTKKQKKKGPKPPRNPNVFRWTPQRKKAALLISTGTKNYIEIAAEIRVNVATIWEWRQSPIFMKEVDRLTFDNEMATKAGLLRLAFEAVNLKKGFESKKLLNDKNTVLDWAEFIVKMLPEDTKDDDEALSKLCDAIMNSAKAIGK